MVTFLRLACIIVLLSIPAIAKAQVDSLRVMKIDGSSISFPIDQIRKLTFKTFLERKEEPKKQGVAVFPNPNQGSFRIAFTATSAGEVEAKLTNVVGSDYGKRTVKVVEGRNVIDWTSSRNHKLPAGCYFLELRTRDWRSIQTINIQ